MELALHFDEEVFVHDWGALSGDPFVQLYDVESFWKSIDELMNEFHTAVGTVGYRGRIQFVR